jgi:hypothetical protein
LIVASEDAQHNTWDPRILAAGGDLSRVHYLAYAPHVTPAMRTPFEFNRHCARLDQLIEEQEIKGVYFDAVYDHFSPDANGNLPKDVRQQLLQVKDVLRDRDCFGVYTVHPNKQHGKSLRDLVGGSHQLVEVARCGLFIGYHPDEKGARVMVFDKGNHTDERTGIKFTAEGAVVPNPETGKLIPTGRIRMGDEEEGLTLRDLSVDPITKREGPSKEEQCRTAIIELLADGEWHRKAEVEEHCGALDFKGGTFRRAFEGAPLEVRQDKHARGQPIECRLRRRET